MNIQDILLLYDYNYWATRKILAASANLSVEQFTAPTTHSWGSLRGTLVHILDAEMGWRLRCLNTQEHVDEELKETDFPTLESLAQRWHEDEQEQRRYLATLRDEDMPSLVIYPVGEEIRKRVLWHILFHVVNHGMQHRSEAAHMLTQYGQSPGELDFTLWLLER